MTISDHGLGMEKIAENVLKIANQTGVPDIEIFLQKNDILQFALGSAVRIAGRRFIEQGIAIRIIKKDRLGFSCGTLDMDPKELIRNAGLQAELSTSKSEKSKMSFSSGETIRDKYTNLSEITSIKRGDLESVVQKMLESALLDPLTKTVESSCSRTLEHRLIVNSNGLLRESLNGWFEAKSQVIVRRQTGEMGFGFDSIRAHNIANLDPYGIGTRAYSTAMLLSNAIKVPSRENNRLKKTRRIIWHPEALGELLAYTIVPSIVRSAQESKPLQKRQNGDNMKFPTGFTILDDPLSSELIPFYSFDDEGITTRQKKLVEQGTLVSSLSAFSPEIPDSGGNCYRVHYFSESPRSFRYPPAPTPANLVLEAVTPSNATNLVEDCSGATILVKRVIGANESNPSNGDFSVNVVECYLVTDNIIKFPTEKISIAGNIFHLLKATKMVGKKETVRPPPLPFAITLPYILTEKSGTVVFRN